MEITEDLVLLTNKKIFSDEVSLFQKIHSWRFKEEKIVFTNGCFDILHYGHIHYLAKAANLGTKLIVALNADRSVKQLKGEKRPVFGEKERAAVLASLWYVDAVYIFEDETPEKTIKQINPNVLVKGGDYEADEIVGSDYVKTQGGEVCIIPFVENFSTTNIIEKLNNLN